MVEDAVKWFVSVWLFIYLGHMADAIFNPFAFISIRFVLPLHVLVCHCNAGCIIHFTVFILSTLFICTVLFALCILFNAFVSKQILFWNRSDFHTCHPRTLNAMPFHQEDAINENAAMKSELEPESIFIVPNTLVVRWPTS